MRPLTARSRALLLATATMLVAGCVYRLDIQQGNILDVEQIDQVQVGMTRSQVRFVLGTPMVADPFDQSRWDYVYWRRQGRGGQVFTSQTTVWFEGDQVVRVERPDRPRPPVDEVVTPESLPDADSADPGRPSAAPG